MAKLIVDKASLVSVADAIREKGNTAESLEFPQGFVEGINAIESGGGGTEEIENIIDESGVLGTTDETVTVTEKVEQLIDKAEDENAWYAFSETVTVRNNLRFTNFLGEKIPKMSLKNMSGIVANFFKGCVNIKRIDFYIDTQKATDFEGFFYDCKSLEYVKGVNTSSANYVTDMFEGCTALKVVEEPFDLTNCRSSSQGRVRLCEKSEIPIETLLFKSETIYFHFELLKLKNLNADSVWSVFNALNSSTTGMTLTLPSQFNKAEAEAVVSANIEVVDGVTRIKGKEGWTLVR